jgi:large subunit ribosomal protein L1
MDVVVSEVDRRRPPETKGEFIKTVAISSTMGPGVRVLRTVDRAV